MKNNRQAVLLIHGIGEQRPMDTLRGFVKAVWETDEKVQHEYAKPGTWSLPDTISDSYELRCLTTSKNKNEVYTDFYEYYWAHLMEGNKISHITAWLKRILFKAPWKLPKPLVGIWWFLAISGLGILYLLFNQVLPDNAQIGLAKSWYSTIIGLVLIPIIMSIFQDIVGDAARYLDPSPKNIKRRQEIRRKGVNMLKKMHDSGKYDRIIVVGHSLGTFIAYDILTHAWQHHNKGVNIKKRARWKTKLPYLNKMNELLVAWEEYIHSTTTPIKISSKDPATVLSREFSKDLSVTDMKAATEGIWLFLKDQILSEKELKKVADKIRPMLKGEKLAEVINLESCPNNKSKDVFVKEMFTKKYRSLQAKVYQEQKENGETWLVTDLVTLGSPLTYSDLLLAKDKEELFVKQQQKELPTIPPVLEKKGKTSTGISYKRKNKWTEVKPEGDEVDDNIYLHDSAMFALTRLTNISFRPSWTIFGDIISGPLQPLFGYGIKDISTKTKILNGLASHTNYWSPEKGDNFEVDHIKELREALDLLDRDSPSEEEEVKG